MHVGRNYWYISPGAVSNGIINVRHGIVIEVGIINKQVSDGDLARPFLNTVRGNAPRISLRMTERR